MKLHFEPKLDFQLQAIDAVCDLFRGQEVCRTEFTVTRDALGGQQALGYTETELGLGNRLMLLDEELLSNLHQVQLRNGLAPSPGLQSHDFTVEMETGTGKTYVYLRTAFQLNHDYGFTKFVIVVPSVAIKEGVYKSLQIMEEHFRGLYANVPFDYFLYDSSKLGQVRNFATSPHIQLMVVTVGAINKKDVNNLYKDSERTGGEKPIDLIRATQPIVIVDEPQSVDGGLSGAGKAALEAMGPLCTLRYSATHADKHHMVYRLDAVDAYERKLVKQIEVASASVEAGHNRPYVRLLSVRNDHGDVRARVELDLEGAHGVRREEKEVRQNDLLDHTTGRQLYEGIIVGEISLRPGDQFLELRCPGETKYLQPGEAYGEVEGLALQRQMIRRTIQEHLDKEKRLRPQGIKVLSLFFIDAVARYRCYAPDGSPQKGDYAVIFEEEYERFRNHPHYRDLFAEVDMAHPATEVHDGYFSIDRKGGWADTAEGNQAGRDNAERAYNLIMKDKERLLSLQTPLKFIFSHSALREGWDNPNVFQICALRDIGTERERRQTIGRGLRLCVNQDGNRVRGAAVNTLTVVATEAYEEFADNLQKEIEADTGIRFGIVEQHQFATIPVATGDGGLVPLGFEQSAALWDYLRAGQYIAPNGRVQDRLREALRDDALELPEQFRAQRPQILEILSKIAGRLDLRNADDRRQVRAREAVLDSEEFRALWERIKHKTTYRVQFDNEKLLADCTHGLRHGPAVASTHLKWVTAGVTISKGGVQAKERHDGTAIVALPHDDLPLPDILTDLQDRTQLTRRSLCRILIDSGRLDDFKRNPQEFIHLATEVTNRCKRLALVDGIKYQRLGEEEYYAQELFRQEELTAYLKHTVEAKKGVYSEVVYDSGTERAFAEDLEKNEAVRVYAKLPAWFRVPTPLGPYNPDWAVLVDTERGERLYFVVETKSTLFTGELRDTESAKIECGKAHFAALAGSGKPVQFTLATTVDELFTGGAGSSGA